MFGGGIGVQEILVVLVVGLLVFGAARLPKIARSLGLGIKEFKKTIKGIEEDDDSKENNVKYVKNRPPINQGQQNWQYNQNMPNQGGSQNMGDVPGSGPGKPQDQSGGEKQNPAQDNAPQSDDS